MGEYLRELPSEEAMAAFYSPVELKPHQHTVATGDFMGMAKHDIACPVCFDAHAMIIRDVSVGRYKQTVQPCSACQRAGYIVARLPYFIRRWFWWGRP